MMTRRVICLLGSVLLAAWFSAAQPSLNFPIETSAFAADYKMPQTLSDPADSPRWELEGEAKPVEYQGRRCLFLNGGAATSFPVRWNCHTEPWRFEVSTNRRQISLLSPLTPTLT